MLIKMQNLTKKFEDLEVIKGLNMEVNEDEIVSVIGPSGCGKSTFLNILSGIITDYDGEYESSNPKIGYVFQEDRLLPWMTVMENIKIVEDKSIDCEVMQIINDVGLKGFENAFPDRLSGGMKQRCAIARGFNYKCDLLLMDEPFKSLDYNLRIDMLNVLIKLWRKSRKSIIFVTHEIDEALTIADRILIFSKRPSKIIKEIVLEKETIGKRNINSGEFIKHRCDIINCLR